MVSKLARTETIRQVLVTAINQYIARIELSQQQNCFSNFAFAWKIGFRSLYPL